MQMIDELHVHDIALIQDAVIEPSGGLTVLTGETGAGKTALLSALRLITGQRADSGVVREGAKEALAEARLVIAGEEHIVSRRLSAQGRSRCSMDGEMATVSQLAQQTQGIRIHNQHEQVLLLRPTAQLSYLDDALGDAASHKGTYLEALASYRAAAQELERLTDAASQEASQEDYARFVLEQIEQVRPAQGEYEELEGSLPRMQHAESLATASYAALEALNGDGGALDLLAQAAQQLARQSGIDPELDSLTERLDLLIDQGQDLARDLRSYQDSVNFDPQELQDVLDRLGELSGLMKRYGPGMEQVFAARDNAQQVLARVQAGPGAIEDARRELSRSEETLRSSAAVLEAARKQAAGTLCATLGSMVAELAMDGASFEFQFEALPFEKWGESGPSHVELLYAPSQQSTPRPLSRIASGGELSRILLAVECAHMQDAPDAGDVTLVFDEVDSGIGGVTGEAVAARLKELSRASQVIVVTHLPQVAAYADAHYLVEKRAADGAVSTAVRLLEGEDRVTEVARMLAGKDDATALDHARSLIAAAKEGK